MFYGPWVYRPAYGDYRCQTRSKGNRSGCQSRCGGEDQCRKAAYSRAWTGVHAPGGGGFCPFVPEKYNTIFGDWIKLPTD